MGDAVALTAAGLLGGSVLASSWFVLRGSAARWSGAFLAAGGGAVLLGCGLALLLSSASTTSRPPSVRSVRWCWSKTQGNG